MEEKIIYDSLEDWKGGKSAGYYEPFLNEIHILKGKDIEFRTLLHEKVHASRKTKLTFKLASIIQIEMVRNTLFGIFTVLTAIGLLTAQYIPFLFMAIFFLFCLFCSAYEEYRADITTLKSMREIKRNERTN
jgi:hypothetical protein